MPDADIDELKRAVAEGETDEFLARTIDGVTMPHRRWLQLNNERHQMRLRFNAFFKDYDILLCPVAASAQARVSFAAARLISRVMSAMP